MPAADRPVLHSAASPGPSALLFTGTVGVGKSSTAEAAGSLLTAAGVPHAVIDVDALRQCRPAPPGDPFHQALTLANLRDVARNFRAAGMAHLLLAGVIESRDERRRYAEALASPLAVVRLRAPVAAVAARLRGRHADDAVESGALAWHLDRAREMEGILDEARVADHDIAAEDPPSQVASAALTAVGWP
ncbi:hypothetical protein [Streptomyces otsuchiensis]|uniref:hypothetical protein n=1 Tax=Streptomyces otsuchiensis TaxID=2681388 RepID=UPI00102FB5FB|nr:hypothetical protein [Streptomyces otsuchiensis]